MNLVIPVCLILYILNNRAIDQNRMYIAIMSVNWFKWDPERVGKLNKNHT